MRTFLTPVMLALLAAPIAAGSPTASAVGICSELKDAFCQGWIICVGYRWASRGFQCTG